MQRYNIGRRFRADLPEKHKEYPVSYTIIVFVKQVPDTTNVRINPETNTLMREGVESIVNPFDEFALEQALELKDRFGARVSVVSMGPPQAKTVLRDALARGADDAHLISSRAFGGADTLATSYTIALAVKKICGGAPDLVLFGKQAIDGDTAQVGPGVSEFLDVPLVTYVKKLEVEADASGAPVAAGAGSDSKTGMKRLISSPASQIGFHWLSKSSGVPSLRLPYWMAEGVGV